MGKAIVFDGFGTLIEYGGARRANPYRRLIEPGGLGSRELFLTSGEPPEELAERLGLSGRIEPMRRELDEEIAGLRLFDDVERTLGRLRREGWRIGVCSNLAAGYAPALRGLLPGLDGYFLSCELGFAKPDERMYRAVEEGMGARAREILFVGDSRRCDLEGPRNFGMRSALLERGQGDDLDAAIARAGMAKAGPKR